MNTLPAFPLELLIFLGVFAVLASVVLTQPRSRRTWRYKTRRPWTHGRVVVAHPATLAGGTTDLGRSDPVSQLRSVMTGSFKAKPVLSRTEAEVMSAAEAAIAEAGLRWRVLAQVALGEVLASDDEAAFRAINAKHVDLLIMCEKRMPLAAIEYQGHGHWQGEAPARDAVKKEALRRAGIGYIEITPKHGHSDVRREIARLARDACKTSLPAFPGSGFPTRAA